jgi:hypothetical protein
VISFLAQNARQMLEDTKCFFAFDLMLILESKTIRKQSKAESIVFETREPKQDE